MAVNKAYFFEKIIKAIIKRRFMTEHESNLNINDIKHQISKCLFWYPEFNSLKDDDLNIILNRTNIYLANLKSKVK